MGCRLAEWGSRGTLPGRAGVGEELNQLRLVEGLPQGLHAVTHRLLRCTELPVSVEPYTLFSDFAGTGTSL